MTVCMCVYIINMCIKMTTDWVRFASPLYLTGSFFLSKLGLFCVVLCIPVVSVLCSCVCVWYNILYSVSPPCCSVWIQEDISYLSNWEYVCVCARLVIYILPLPCLSVCLPSLCDVQCCDTRDMCKCGPKSNWVVMPDRTDVLDFYVLFVRIRNVHIILPIPAGERSVHHRNGISKRRDYLLNLSISLSRGRETNQDSLSNGE